MAYRILTFFLFVLLCACKNNGAGDMIDLSGRWRFSADQQNQGLEGKWHSPDYNDSGWVTIEAGTRWEDQGFAEIDGWAWYRKTVKIPSEWRGKAVWLISGGVNDMYTLYVNGEAVDSFGDLTSKTVAEKTTMAEVSRFLHYGRKNLFTLQVNDWGNSGGLWRLPVFLTANLSSMVEVPLLSVLPVYEKNEVLINNNFSCLGNKSRTGYLTLTMTASGRTEPVVRYEVKLDSSRKTLTVNLPLPSGEARGPYELREVLTDRKGNTPLSLARQIEWTPPPVTADAYGARRKNNFVTELLHEQADSDRYSRWSFHQKRKGWIFISIRQPADEHDAPRAFLDNVREALIFRMNPDDGAYEAMRFLSAGDHTLAIDMKAGSELLIRQIPEIIFSDYPSTPHIEPYGPYNWSYMSKFVLPHVNTIVTSGHGPAPAELEQWRREGRHWLVHAGLPGLGQRRPPEVSEVSGTWAKNSGMADPRFQGMIVDEFVTAGADHYRVWTRALSALYKNPAFYDKKFYAYCTDIFYAERAPAIPFGAKLIELDGRFAIERYLPEKSSESGAYASLFESLSQTYRRMQESLAGVGEHLIITLGYLTDPTETLSVYPSVDYRVFMDMQFHLLATDPVFEDLYGIQEYLSSYADEELLRWAHRLFRHYCIEGKRTRLTTDPYLLPHLQNPDFSDGLEYWQIEAAAPGSVRIMTMPGYSWLQGRYPRTAYGDQFICLKRSAGQPNRIRQVVKELDPSRLYALKIIAADRKQLDKKQKLALTIDLKGADIINDQSFRYVYPSNYGHTLGPFNRDHPAWFNFYRIVFRPKSESALLSISDWQNPVNAGGPVGQEIIFNFIEIQPFLEK